MIDLDEIARSVSHTTQLKEPVMTLAQKLSAEGRNEGIAIGEARAKVRLLEKILQEPATSDDVLATLSLDELEQRFAALDAEYKCTFQEPLIVRAFGCAPKPNVSTFPCGPRGTRLPTESAPPSELSNSSSHSPPLYAILRAGWRLF